MRRFDRPASIRRWNKISDRATYVIARIVPNGSYLPTAIKIGFPRCAELENREQVCVKTALDCAALSHFTARAIRLDATLSGAARTGRDTSSNDRTVKMPVASTMPRETRSARKPGWKGRRAWNSLTGLWKRRGRDSNPGSPCGDSGFQDRCNRPLCHLSVLRTIHAENAPKSSKVYRRLRSLTTGWRRFEESFRRDAFGKNSAALSRFVGRSIVKHRLRLQRAGSILGLHWRVRREHIEGVAYAATGSKRVRFPRRFIRGPGSCRDSIRTVGALFVPTRSRSSSCLERPWFVVSGSLRSSWR